MSKSKAPRTVTTSIIAVARRAQVSVGTVSRVINGHSAVLPANIAAVRQAMADLAYQPPAPENRRGRRRAVTAPPRIALVLLGDYDLAWMTERSPVYAAVVYGIQAALAEQGCDLVVRHVPSYTGLTQVMRQQPPSGVLWFGAEPLDEPSPEWRALPAVWVMGSPRRFSGDHVAPNHRRIGLLAARALHADGHRVCGFLGWDLRHSDPHLNDGRQRGLVLRAALEAVGGSMPALSQDGLYDSLRNRIDETVLADRLDQMFAATPKPTALFLGMDAYAPSVYRYLHRRGLVVGRDVAIITCNNERAFLNGLHPAPLVIDIHARHIGHRAVERLCWRIAHPLAPAEELLIAPSLIPA